LNSGEGYSREKMSKPLSSIQPVLYAKLWLQCAPYSGMEEQDFFHYFRGITTGFAIEMNHIIQFDEPIDPQDLFPQFVPPQSFCYLADDVHIP